ncbi:MAG: hypothetical protein M0018_05120 [Nitrospiraceae bacterium]|nr:hypothetical protein [Nitrospiraceae bacterium]
MAASKEIMMSYFKKHHFEENLVRLVSAKDPVRGSRSRILHAHGVIAKSIEDLSLMVSEIEPDGKDIPILLRQYLKLGGKLLGFSRDRKFSNVLDSLVLVNLAEVDSRILQKYMGTEGTERLLAFHRGQLRASA